MKMGTFTSIALLGGALVLPSHADKVKFEQLPASVQEKIRAQAGSAPIEDIDRETRNGKTVYEVAFKKNGQNTEIKIEEDAAVAATSASAPLDSRKISYNEVPEDVRRIADARIQGGEVNDVDRQVRNGRVTYEIGFKRNGGPQQELIISDDGRILSRPRSRATAASSAAASATTSPSTAANAVTSRAISYAELPQNVRRIAEANLRQGNVSQVQRRVQNGEVSYEIDFEKDNGRHQMFAVTEDGRIVRNEMLQSSATGSAATSESGSATTATASQAAQYSYVTSPVSLRNAAQVQLGEVPSDVRRAMRQFTNSGKVEEILRGDWGGKPVYQIAFTDQNNRYVELQLDDNGQVIYDPRSAATAPKTPGSILNQLGRSLLDTTK